MVHKRKGFRELALLHSKIPVISNFDFSPKNKSKFRRLQNDKGINKTYRKNGECLEISVLLEDDLGKWLLTRPESVIHDFVLFEYKNNCTDRAQYRRVQSLDASVDNGHDFEDESVNLMADLIRSELKDAVEDAILQLTPKQQWIVRQVYFLDRKISDVASELSVSRPALSQQFNVIYT